MSNQHINGDHVSAGRSGRDGEQLDLSPGLRARLSRLFIDDRPIGLADLGRILSRDPSKPLSVHRVREICKDGFHVGRRAIRPVVTNFGTYRGVRPTDLERFIAELSAAYDRPRGGSGSNQRTPQSQVRRRAETQQAHAINPHMTPTMFTRRKTVSLSSPPESGGFNGMDAVGHAGRKPDAAVSPPRRSAGRRGT